MSKCLATNCVSKKTIVDEYNNTVRSPCYVYCTWWTFEEMVLRARMLKCKTELIKAGNKT